MSLIPKLCLMVLVLVTLKTLKVVKLHHCQMCRVEELRDFVQTLNEIHPTTKFTAEWSQESINFWDVTVSLIDGQIEIDVYVQPTDSHQYLHSSSCHRYHCKKIIPYSQSLRFNRICSKNNFFDIYCNNLEKWLSERGYSE